MEYLYLNTKIKLECVVFIKYKIKKIFIQQTKNEKIPFIDVTNLSNVV